MDRRRTARRMTFSSLETLEDRLVLSTAVAANPLEAAVDLKGGPTLGLIYTEYFNYVVSGSQGAFVAPQADKVEMVGPTVGVDVQFSSGNFLSNAANMEQLGMVVTASNPTLGIVEGFMPIGQLPSVAVDPNMSSLTPVFKPTTVLLPTTTTASLDATVTLKGGPALGSIYQEYVNYEQAGGTGTFSPVEASQIEFSGTAVGVDVRTSAANYTTLLGELKTLGMQVTATSPQSGVIEGFLPIAQLPSVATNGVVTGMSPIYKPTAF